MYVTQCFSHAAFKILCLSLSNFTVMLLYVDYLHLPYLEFIELGCVD